MFVKESCDRQLREHCDEIISLNAKSMTVTLNHDRMHDLKLKGE